ncbi:hypothetical protein V6N11_036672 [Hibiscus sabdariffa]|uniref:Uncharacterized protein n=1 Tax=Hibiscus sabdariffa TaxID=183260 RepID=A0ABR2RB42_9ROSI
MILVLSKIMSEVELGIKCKKIPATITKTGKMKDLHVFSWHHEEVEARPKSVFNLPAMAMEKAKGDPRQKRVPPKRGQIKGRIVSTIMESVLRVVSNAGKRLQRKKKKVVASEEMQLQKNQIKLA